MDYHQFIRDKELKFTVSGFDAESVNEYLKPFQRDIVKWALKLGKAALFLQCGLGKTICQLSWADAVINHTSGKVLLLTPLAVSPQTLREASKFSIDGVRLCRDGAVKDSDRIVVTNYENLHKFSSVDFVGVVLDESSILKSFSSATRNQLIEMFDGTPYRLACTATPSPNDYMELGNHAEFLGIMSRVEMLAHFFTHDGGDTSKWRLKGHAQDEFWKWVGSWAVMLNNPSDMGYKDDGYNLPPIAYQEFLVESQLTPDEGQLFKLEASGLLERRRARRESIADRVAKAAEIVNNSDEQWLVWCDLNDEGDMLEAAIDGAVQVAGKDTIEHKESSLLSFADGEFKVLISKPSIAGFGMNFQNCHNIIFVGLSDSYESMHQAISRCYRFGQTKQVNVYIITASTEGAVLRNIRRKEQDAIAMAESMIKHISVNQNVKSTVRQTDEYNPTQLLILPKWMAA